MNRYSCRVAWSNEDDCYIATTPEFARLSAFGDTPAEAVTELGVAIGLAIELFEKEGWDLPTPRLIGDEKCKS